MFARHYGVRAYDYWHGYTAAQIELMALDQPVTVYPKDKKDRKNGGHTAAEMKKIAEEWEKKYGKAGRVSEKVSLSEFLGGGEPKSDNK